MTQHHQQHTAKIYAFPKRPRAASRNHQAACEPAQAACEPARRDTQFTAMEFGAGWYHEAAVEDALDDASVPFRKH